MYAQEIKTLRVNEAEQVVLSELATLMRAWKPATTSEAPVELVVSILEAVGRGTAVTIALLSGHVSLIDARNSFKISPTGFQRWLDHLDIAVVKEGNFGYISRGEYHRIRRWRMEMLVPDVP